MTVIPLFASRDERIARDIRTGIRGLVLLAQKRDDDVIMDVVRRLTELVNEHEESFKGRSGT